MLRSLIAQDAAVARVGYRLAIANRDLCPRTAPLPGFLVHSPSQYAPEYRADLREVAGLSSGFGIAAVIDGSPAERAGLHSGDILLKVDGAALDSPKAAKADYGPVETLNARLDEAMADDMLELAVLRRDGTQQTLSFRPDSGCAVQFQVTGGKGWDAATDGRIVTLQSGIVAATANDAELAVTLAHELAHVVYRDPERGGPGPAGGREARADVIGQYLMARAGYDAGAAATFWARYGDSHPLDFLGTTGGHASPKARTRRASETAAEIARRQAAGTELWPEDYAPPGS